MAYSEYLVNRVRQRLKISNIAEEKKIMGSFLFIDPEGFDVETDLDCWIERALELNKLLTT